MLDLVQKAGGDVLSFDWRINIDSARALLGNDLPVQGNLDPVTLFAPIPTIQERVHDILKRAGGRGHIFNLGHGILQHTPVEHVRAVVEMVHEYEHD
jgi:uroporphyrinogen decarboxylase